MQNTITYFSLAEVKTINFKCAVLQHFSHRILFTFMICTYMALALNIEIVSFCTNILTIIITFYMRGTPSLIILVLNDKKAG